jgi:hypothetical protein
MCCLDYVDVISSIKQCAEKLPEDRMYSLNGVDFC